MTEEQEKFMRLTVKPKHRRLTVIKRTVTDVIRNMIDNTVYTYYLLKTKLGACEHIVRNELIGVETTTLPYHEIFKGESLQATVNFRRTRFMDIHDDYFRSKKGNLKWFSKDEQTLYMYKAIPSDFYIKISEHHPFVPCKTMEGVLIKTDKLYRQILGEHCAKYHRFDFSILRSVGAEKEIVGYELTEEEEKDLTDWLFARLKEILYNISIKHLLKEVDKEVMKDEG